jgi:uncharacterized membrane protein (DUF106 family)
MASLTANKLALEKHQRIITLYNNYYIKARNKEDKRELGKLINKHSQMIESLQARIRTKGVC